MVENVEIGAPIANSDHATITFNLVCETVIEQSNLQRFNYHKGKYEYIYMDVAEVDWDKKCEGCGVDSMWNCFKDFLIEKRNIYVPQQTVSEKKYPCWMNFRIKKMIGIRNKAWKKLKKEPTYVKDIEYKTLRNSTTAAVRKAKKDYEYKLAEKIKVDSKSFYAYVRSRSQTKTKVGPLKSASGRLINDNQGMVEILNDYFATVFTVENVQHIPTSSKYCQNGKDVSPECG